MNEIGFDPGIDHMLAMQCFDEVHSKGGKVCSRGRGGEWRKNLLTREEGREERSAHEGGGRGGKVCSRGRRGGEGRKGLLTREERRGGKVCSR